MGVLLDCNLSWKYHINELSKKLSRTIGIFYKIRHFVPCEILKTLYYSLFYSFVSYGIAVWGFTYKSHIQKLSLLQKKIIRVMAFKKSKVLKSRLTGLLTFNTEVGQKTRKLDVAYKVDYIFSSEVKNESIFSMLKLAPDAKLPFSLEFWRHTAKPGPLDLSGLLTH